MSDKSELTTTLWVQGASFLSQLYLPSTQQTKVWLNHKMSFLPSLPGNETDSTGARLVKGVDATWDWTLGKCEQIPYFPNRTQVGYLGKKLLLGDGDASCRATYSEKQCVLAEKMRDIAMFGTVAAGTALVSGVVFYAASKAKAVSKVALYTSAIATGACGAVVAKGCYDFFANKP